MYRLLAIEVDDSISACRFPCRLCRPTEFSTILVLESFYEP